MKEKQMKKIMNFRLFLYIALSLIASTLLSVYVFASEKSKLVFLIVCAVSIFVCLILTLIFKKKFLIILLVLLTAFIIPVLSVYSKSISLNQNCSKNVENCQFYGKIYTRKADLDKKVIKLYLTDVKINSNENINGDIFVYINTENLDVSKLEVGTTVQVNGTIKLYSLQDEDLSKAVSKLQNTVDKPGASLGSQQKSAKIPVYNVLIFSSLKKCLVNSSAFILKYFFNFNAWIINLNLVVNVCLDIAKYLSSKTLS